MKANWKIALMCFAALAFVACTEKNKPNHGGDDDETEYVQKILVNDNSLADWANVPQDKIVSFTCPANAAKLGLKSVKVYADEYYIFIQIEPNPDDITSLAWVPFHVYLNTDNSDETGGYGDQFTDANSDVLLEGAVFGSEDATTLAAAAIPWGPAVFHWWGEVGGNEWVWQDPTVEHSGDDKWGADVGEGELAGTTSQFVDGKIEIQIMRELVPTPAGWSDSEFGIGFDIQQSWQSVGILPCAASTDENPNGLAPKLQVKIDK